MKVKSRCQRNKVARKSGLESVQSPCGNLRLPSLSHSAAVTTPSCLLVSALPPHSTRARESVCIGRNMKFILQPRAGARACYRWHGESGSQAIDEFSKKILTRWRKCHVLMEMLKKDPWVKECGCGSWVDLFLVLGLSVTGRMGATQAHVLSWRRRRRYMSSNTSFFVCDFMSFHCRIKFISVGSTDITNPGTHVGWTVWWWSFAPWDWRTQICRDQAGHIND